MANKQAVRVDHPVLKAHLVSLRITESLGNCILSLRQVPPRHASARYHLPPQTYKGQVTPPPDFMQGPGTPPNMKVPGILPLTSRARYLHPDMQLH